MATVPAHWQSLLRARRQPGERQTAARAIQYLGTPEAARFMAAHLDEPGILGVWTLLAVPPLGMLLASRETPARSTRAQPVRLPYGPHEEQRPRSTLR